jgi:hypothetical protein
MKYSTWIMALSTINIVTLFSGFPTGTKKIIIVLATAGIIFIGLILRAIEKKQQARIEQKKRAVVQTYPESLSAVAQAVAEDVHEQVIEDIAEIIHKETTSHYDKETIT